jgi:hypothetical protein
MDDSLMKQTELLLSKMGTGNKKPQSLIRDHGIWWLLRLGLNQ